jgi:hypothetical protein
MSEAIPQSSCMPPWCGKGILTLFLTESNTYIVRRTGGRKRGKSEIDGVYCMTNSFTLWLLYEIF